MQYTINSTLAKLVSLQMGAVRQTFKNEGFTELLLPYLARAEKHPYEPLFELNYLEEKFFLTLCNPACM